MARRKTKRQLRRKQGTYNGPRPHHMTMEEARKIVKLVSLCRSMSEAWNGREYIGTLYGLSYAKPLRRPDPALDWWASYQAHNAIYQNIRPVVPQKYNLSEKDWHRWVAWRKAGLEWIAQNYPPRYLRRKAKKLVQREKETGE